MQVQVNTVGRTDLKDLFELSGVLTYTRLTHTPFLVFETKGLEVNVHTIDRATKLSKFPPETPVMVQWEGEWRSDFFRMSVGDILKALDERKRR